MHTLSCLQGKVVAQGTFEHIVDLATVKEDNPQSVILRGVLSEMLGEDAEGQEEEEAHKDQALGAIKCTLDAITEEGEEDAVFTKKRPASPFSLPTPSAARPRVFASKPKLLRRVTDMDLIRRRTLSPLLLSPATPKLRKPSSKFGASVPQASPRASRYTSQRGQTPVTTQPAQSGSPHPQVARSLSQAVFKLPAPLLRRATEGAFNTRRRSSANQSGPSLAPFVGKCFSE